MTFKTVGQNIRKCRIAKNMKQEDLAEKTGLSANYIGMIERGEKCPSLETFISILNALDASADLVLADLLSSGYKTKSSKLREILRGMPPKERNLFFDIAKTLLDYFK